MPLTYDKIFDTKTERKRPDALPPYVYDDEGVIEFAVNVAIATRRPLLVTGYPGCGKSTLAEDIAFLMGCSYLEAVITPRTQARDLLWTFDDVKRLSDATGQGTKVKEDSHYIEPGVLWWTFDRGSATRVSDEGYPGKDYGEGVDVATKSDGDPWRPRQVLLIDEIDKADPDVPNSLLTVFSANRFSVRGRKEPVTWTDDDLPLVVLTSNNERELPGPFRRRCVMLDVEYPSKELLAHIAKQHQPRWKNTPQVNDELIKALAKQTNDIKDKCLRRHLRPPGVSEFLDAVRALSELASAKRRDDGAREHAPGAFSDEKFIARVVKMAMDKEGRRR